MSEQSNSKDYVDIETFLKWAGRLWCGPPPRNPQLFSIKMVQECIIHRGKSLKSMAAASDLIKKQIYG